MRKLQLIFVLIISLVEVTIAQKHEPLPDWAMGDFVRPEGVNPIIKPNPSAVFDCPMTGESVQWALSDTFNPAAVVKGNRVYVLFRSEDNSQVGIGRRTSRICLATSKDALTMQCSATPVLYPDNDKLKDMEWPGGCEDPRVCVTEDGLYVMAYTAWNRVVPRLAIATSPDLVHWQKHGLAFAKAYNGKFENTESKSASIVTKIVDGKQVIAKVNGKYFMYWGECNIHAATSDDLINWTPVVDHNGELAVLASPRKGYFDSMLTECGPPAIVTDKGILVVYNGKNGIDDSRDPNYPAGTYCAGQIIFDMSNPLKAIGRLDTPFFYPSEDFEKSGQYVDGTVFVEGLVFFKKRWYLYYGCADSMVGVAVYDPKKTKK